MLSTKDLMFKEQLVKKLTERFVEPYTIKEIISANPIKLKLPESIRIHPVENNSDWVVRNLSKSI